MNKLVNTTKVVYTEFGLLTKLISDAGTSFTSDTFKQFCKKMNIQQAITLSYHHQSNGQVEAFIEFVKIIVKNALIIIMM